MTEKITFRMYQNKQKQDNLSEKDTNSKARHAIRFHHHRSRKSTGELRNKKNKKGV